MCYSVLRIAGAAKIILADFNLAVSTPTAKSHTLRRFPFPIRLSHLRWMSTMGQSGSRPSFHKLAKKDGGSFVLVSNEREECIQFEPAESYMVSYGIDLQTSPKYKYNILSPLTIADAEQVLTTLVDVGAIHPENGVLYAASKLPEQCTFEGMKVGFQEQAKKVGQNGLFVFHFSGHGIMVQNKWGLVPADFDRTWTTYLTADVLNQWLQEVGCKAKHILFTLDCCYAGGIANELTTSGNWSKKDLGLYVISACTANEASLVFESLGHSVFTYFLARAISTLTSNPGQLPVHDIFKECQACSVALSSLLMSYDPQLGITWGRTQPQMRIKPDGDEFLDEPDEMVVGRFEFVNQLFDRDKQKPSLDHTTHAWLKTLTKGPLIELEQRHVLQEKVLDVALCSIMYSIASIEIGFNRTNVDNPNHFLIAFMHAVATLDLLKQGVKVNNDQLVQSWGFYHEVLVKNKVNDEELRKLYDRLIPMKKRVASDGSDEDYAEFGKVSSMHDSDSMI